MARPIRVSLAAADADDHSRATLAVLAAGSNQDTQQRAENLALSLKLPLADAAVRQAYDFLLVYTPERIELHENRAQRSKPVFVDCVLPSVQLHRAHLSRKQPLARAFGKAVRTVVDTTAGLGRDACLLCYLGYRVTAIERCAPIYALLHDGLRRWQHDAKVSPDVSERLTVLHADARLVLPRLRPKPDAIYLDPMFPPKRKKSAAVRKELRLLRQLAGEDRDAEELFELGLRCAAKRVVVKRSDDAPPLAPRPLVSYPGKLVRYDVYAAVPSS
jgi:16S rRNA (guanine1516-N2)-methyltransferase